MALNHASKLLLLLLSLGSVATQAIAANLLAGPMQGATAMRSAVIWLQAESGKKSAQIVYWHENAPEKVWKTQVINLTTETDFVAHVTLDNLNPSQRYAYRVVIDGESSKDVYHFSTQTLWKWRTDPPNTKVLLGSCSYINEPEYDRPGKSHGQGYQIFNEMAKHNPNLTLWLGDNLYFREADNSPSGMRMRYKHDRALPELQPLLQKGAHVAIWDDHDYGPNDANASFEYKDTALALFKRYWANPSYGLPDMPGISTVVHQDDADFFLIDGRWYRDDDKLTAEDKAMFGKQQIRWLKNALLNSSASFKFIVSGSQLLDDQSKYEGWRNFPQERQEFIDWLTLSKINGVVFLSGDRHHTELLAMQRENAYPLYELTCSPLTSGTHDITEEQRNPRLVEGTLVGERNFCALEFSGTRKNRQLVVKSHNTEGRLLWEKSMNIQDLSHTDSK